MSESSEHNEGGATGSADSYLSARRQNLNESLLKWSKLFVGGGAVAIGGALLYPVSAPIGLAVGVGGAAAEVVGYIGIVGNLLKRFKKENR